MPGRFADILWATFFGGFGWSNVWLPPWLYGLYGLAFLGGLAVAALALRPVSRGRASPATLLFLAVWSAAVLARRFLVIGGVSSYGHGRFLYPALATLAAFGWGRAAVWWPRLRPLALTAVGAGALPRSPSPGA